jgi:hypothetical protein
MIFAVRMPDWRLSASFAVRGESAPVVSALVCVQGDTASAKIGQNIQWTFR